METAVKLKLKDVTEDMQKRIRSMARHTYDQIGPDLPKRMKQSEVIEVVGDADYMKMHGADKEAYEVWNKMSYNDQNKILKQAFPGKVYEA